MTREKEAPKSTKRSATLMSNWLETSSTATTTGQTSATDTLVSTSLILPPANTTSTTEIHTETSNSNQPTPKEKDPVSTIVDGVEELAITKKFRFQGRSVFLTFPQCETTLQVAVENLEKKSKVPVEEYIIACEKHQDGNTHLHAYIKFGKKLNIARSDFFNYIGGKQPNIQKVKNKEYCVAYVAKDGNYISKSLDIPAITQQVAKKKELKKRKIEKKNILVFNAVRDGKTYDDLMCDELLGPYLVTHGNSVKTFLVDYEDMLQKRRKPNEKPKICILEIQGKRFNLLKNWEFKEKQFYIYGPPDSGKTTMIMQLEKCGLRGFEIPKNNDFARYDDSKFDFCYLDEFKGQVTVQFLNEFLQGSRMTLPGKYVQGGRVKKKNMPIFIISNYSPNDCYVNKTIFDLQPLLSRLNVFEFKGQGEYQVISEEEDMLLPEFLNASPITISDLYSNETI